MDLNTRYACYIPTSNLPQRMYLNCEQTEDIKEMLAPDADTLRRFCAALSMFENMRTLDIFTMPLTAMYLDPSDWTDCIWLRSMRC
jgi:hypothetical protein